MQVEAWSDVVRRGPRCWIGSHPEAALERFGPGDAVEVVWRAFELDPTATSDPVSRTGPEAPSDRPAPSAWRPSTAPTSPAASR